MITHSYPRREIRPAEVFTQETLDLATAHLLSWHQGPGILGGLYLHACWGISSVLDNRYQGPTTWLYHNSIKGFMRLFDRTREERWRTLADNCVSELLFLQTAEGGFLHANYQYEPAYNCRESCPIHQGMPVLALLDYAAWPAADPRRVALIRPAVDAHWQWFERVWWKQGNSWLQPLPFAGFCGVTNQDLVIVALLARYAAVYGDASRYEKFGRPTLETYLSSRYYHEKLGVFERGDEPNFVERTFYNDVIIPMLEIIQQTMPDPRLPGVIDNVCAHLFDAVQPGPDGLMHIAWGANTDPVDKSAVTSWIATPHPLANYPQILKILQSYLQRRPSAEYQRKYDALEKTTAAYVLPDGALPVALGAKDALFTATPRVEYLWTYLIDRLGDKLRSPADRPLPQVHHRFGAVTWKADARHWALYRDGRREFAGLKAQACAIAIGPDEQIAGAAFEELNAADFSSHISAQ